MATERLSLRIDAGLKKDLVEGMAGIREFPIPRTPFSFIYRVVDDRIEVLRVRDQRGDRSRLG